MSSPSQIERTLTWLSTTEIRFLRLLNRAAGLLILMLRLQRPVTAIQAGVFLDLHPQTVKGYFRTLQDLKLVSPDRVGGAFQLAKDLGEPGAGAGVSSALSELLVKFSRENPAITAIKDSNFNDSDSLVVIDPDGKNIAPLPASPLDPEVMQALKQAGISEPKRSALARMPGMTARKVRLWEQQLRQKKGTAYREGLLIHVLESDLPDPPSRPNGHLQTCDCSDCSRYKYDVCLNCFSNPCQCGWDDPETNDSLDDG